VPLPHAGDDAFRPLRYVDQGARIGDHRDHGLNPPRDVGGTSRDDSAGRNERLGPDGIAIPDDEFVAGVGEPARDAAPHRTEPDDPDCRHRLGRPLDPVE